MILAIDTATDLIGLSLDDGNQVLAERIWRSARHHTTELAPALALMLRTCDVSPTDLTGLAVAQGPGSYTGLRIGMALAKGMALAHGIELVGVPTLDIIARAQFPRDVPLVAVIGAGRGRVACGWYKWDQSRWQPQSAPANYSWEGVIEALSTPTYVCGEIGEGRGRLRRAKNVILAEPEHCLRRPSYLAAIARERLVDEGSTEPAALAPVYLGDLDGSPP